jgi:hypothetical protein
MFLLRLEYPQVAPPVVRLVSICVMDNLSRKELATQLAFGNVAVHWYSGVRITFVALLVFEPSYHT